MIITIFSSAASSSLRFVIAQMYCYEFMNFAERPTYVCMCMNVRMKYEQQKHRNGIRASARAKQYNKLWFSICLRLPSQMARLRYGRTFVVVLHLVHWTKLCVCVCVYNYKMRFFTIISPLNDFKANLKEYLTTKLRSSCIPFVCSSMFFSLRLFFLFMNGRWILSMSSRW